MGPHLVEEEQVGEGGGGVGAGDGGVQQALAQA